MARGSFSTPPPHAYFNLHLTKVWSPSRISICILMSISCLKKNKFSSCGEWAVPQVYKSLNIDTPLSLTYPVVNLMTTQDQRSARTHSGPGPTLTLVWRRPMSGVTPGLGPSRAKIWRSPRWKQLQRWYSRSCGTAPHGARPHRSHSPRFRAGPSLAQYQVSRSTRVGATLGLARLQVQSSPRFAAAPGSEQPQFLTLSRFVTRQVWSPRRFSLTAGVAARQFSLRARFRAVTAFVQVQINADCGALQIFALSRFRA